MVVPSAGVVSIGGNRVALAMAALVVTKSRRVIADVMSLIDGNWVRGNWPRWIRTTIPRSKVWCPAVGRGASYVEALELSGAESLAGGSRRAEGVPLENRFATARARSASSITL